MIVIFHVLSALSSLLFTSYTYIFPTINKIRTGCGLISITLISGTYLVVSTKSNMLKACLTGLIYLAVVATLTVVAHHRLATAKSAPKSTD